MPRLSRRCDEWEVQLKLIQPLKSTTIHSINNSRSNRNCIVFMKWCKTLLFLPCCLRFLAHSGSENLYQSYIYPGGANMNHQTIYSGRCHYHGSSIYKSSSQKAGSSKSWQACSHRWTCSSFLGNYVARINTHVSVSIQYYWAINFRVFFQN